MSGYLSSCSIAVLAAVFAVPAQAEIAPGDYACVFDQGRWLGESRHLVVSTDDVVMTSGDDDEESETIDRFLLTEHHIRSSHVERLRFERGTGDHTLQYTLDRYWVDANPDTIRFHLFVMRRNPLPAAPHEPEIRWISHAAGPCQFEPNEPPA